MLIGGALGLLGGVAVAWLIYRGLLVIPASRLLSVTGWLIVLLAAGMASQAVAFLQQAGYLAFLDTPLWSTRAILSDGSIAGRAAHALVGYTDQPNGLQLLAWLATILVARLLARATPPARGRAPAAHPSR
jgi:high-affinity iron transporter